MLAVPCLTARVDDGASQKIIDGSIKLKADRHISQFTPTGLLSEDSSALDMDIVISATGYIHLLLLGKLLGKQPHSYGDTCEAYLQLLPADLHNTIQPIWGINEEGELDSASCEIGRHGPDADKVASLWLLMGNLAMCWFFSKHVALQIKAYEDLGIFGVRY
ncbi:hypothetical protein EDD16DRAFT_1787825 [Pisolithus croceorrhizus]|nr:hypothetical protein EDD16DRAFT_1787825 [Pisolithus croceorrhizus]KAI6158817.1 hypothetical protein EDD17DRAFT_1843102 [Pisolithus thermaeus]